MRAVDRGHYSTDPDQAYCDRPHGIGCCTLPCVRAACRVVSCVVSCGTHSLVCVCVCLQRKPSPRRTCTRCVSSCFWTTPSLGTPSPSLSPSLGSRLRPPTHGRKFLGRAKVLDVGSGSGYLTACLGHLVGDQGKVIGIDRHTHTHTRHDTTHHAVPCVSCCAALDVRRVSCGVWHA
jgi:hypothetical protein